jgi:acyl carrier protein
MEQLKEMLKSKFPTVDFDNETALTSSGILDSLAVVTIIAELENLFDISVTMEYIQPKYFESVETMWEMVEELM